MIGDLRPEAPLRNASTAARRPEGHVNLSGIKVMVIDDSNTIRRSAEIFPRPGRLSGRALAEDGFDALAKITDHAPDLIFVDIMMPRLDGYQTCALIKKNPASRPHRSSCCPSKDGLRPRPRPPRRFRRIPTKPFTKESLLRLVASHTQSRQLSALD